MATSDDTGWFGVLLQRHRTAAALSQEELAERVGVSRRAVADLERGARRAPHPATVRQLADALKLNDADRAAFIAACHHGDTTPLRRDAAARAVPPVKGVPDGQEPFAAAAQPVQRRRPVSSD